MPCMHVARMLAFMRCARTALAVLLLGLAACGEPAAVRANRAKEIAVVLQPNITGRDGGSSAQLWGRSVWSFGDSVVATKDADEQTWHHNSYAFVSAFDGASGAIELTSPADDVGSPRYLIPPTADEAAFNAAHRGDDCAQKPCGARFAVWPGQPVWDEARARGVEIAGSELIGLMPQAALEMAAAQILKIENFTPDRVFERRLRGIVQAS